MAWSPSPSRLVGSSRAGPEAGPSGLKILAAGIPRDERRLVEAEVRQALASRDVSEPWTVSLVKLAGRWSVTLNGPGERFRNLSFSAEESRLGAAIRETLEPEPQGRAADASTTTHAASPAAEVRQEHRCPYCSQAVVVVYEARPNEPQVPAALACPHCWQISHVDVGAWAAAGRDYRAEKA